ncbi:MAG: PIN domain-containing protein [Microbacterium sp.]|uniref:type II toxin-antitoxin system VapC family toxin n=1 Tax=Microbacterium sp. TaxID=51671 RepID=UPI0039E45284
MIAIDTNLLVYAHREDSPHHAAAAEVLRELAGGVGAWAVPWPCVHEFLAVVTHPRVYAPPTPPAVALAAVDALAALPNLRLLHESPSHLVELDRLLSRGDVTGARVHDARIAAICIAHGVSELWSADRDFSWFPALRTRNPLAH